MYNRYFVPKKISEELFNQFALAIGEMLHDIYSRNDGSEISQPEYLKRQIPNLTTEQYRAIHRTHFEHMARVAKTMVKERLKELL